MNWQRKINQGFTLIEIIVYIAVLSLLVVSVSAFALWAIRSQTKSKAMTEVLNNGRRAMEIMTQEIKEAKGLYAPTITANQLSLETKKYLPTGETNTYLDFYLCGSRLCLKKESQEIIPLTSDNVQISNLVFTQIATSSPSVQIDLTIDYKNPNNRVEYQASVNLKSTAALRSY